MRMNQRTPNTRSLAIGNDLSIEEPNWYSTNKSTLKSNFLNIKNHYPSKRREEDLLPALMKIKNTALFRDYNRILKPLQDHQKMNRKINQFLKSSYRKDIKVTHPKVCMWFFYQLYSFIKEFWVSFNLL